MKLVSFLFLIGMMYLSYRVVRFIIERLGGRPDPCTRGQELITEHIRNTNQVLRQDPPSQYRLKNLYEEGERLLWACRNSGFCVDPVQMQLLMVVQELLTQQITTHTDDVH